MLIRITQAKAGTYEGHIKVAYPVGRLVDVGQADAERLVAEGIAELVVVDSHTSPQENAAAAPNETKKVKCS